jgi:glycosyltransferase involved in cell wall biosynthesis
MSLTFAAVVPNYNDASKIAQSLKSLAAQTTPFAEIIIVDDGSKDDSVAVIRRLIADMPNARLIESPQNGGVVAAINIGLAAVTSEFVFLCSANDFYQPNMVAIAAEMLALYPQAGIVSGNVGAYDELKKADDYDMKLPLPQQRKYYSPADFVMQNKQVGVHFNGGANALRMSLVREFGGLRPPLKWHSDWFLNLMCAFRAGVVYVPENFMICRLEGKKSYSSNRHHWPTERQVIDDSLSAIAEFPNEAALFQQSALLPKYDIRALPLLFSKYSHFVSPLLLWRMKMHSMTYWTKKIVPRPVLMALRPLVRF